MPSSKTAGSRKSGAGTDRKVAATDGFIRVRGAREHNLRNVDVDIPRDALVVFTGISGSGKSSLAFGTLYAEAQRRYFESVAPYARRLIDQVGVPDVDEIDGLPPAVALQQQRGTTSARSTLGSLTSISSLVRMLYSRAGSYPPRQPMLYAEDFSPNTTQGTCPTCHGLGRIYDATEQSMVPDDSLSIRQRAIAAWPPAWHGQNLRDILVTLGYDVDRPWRDLPRKDRDWILYTDEQPTMPVYPGFTPAETRAALSRKLDPAYQGTFTSARRYVLQTFATTQSALMKKRVSRYLLASPCPTCDGKRLKREALSVRFAGHDIGELSAMPLQALREHLAPVVAGRFDAPASSATLARGVGEADRRRRRVQGHSAHRAAPDVRLTPELSPEKRLAAQRLAGDIVARTDALIRLGLGYLSLDRVTVTLSPGELQRIRLATQIRSNLFGVVYVLDEPSAGLHPADAESLIDALGALKAGGNSLFVVEHDLDVIRRADWIVDVGPGAGSHGGEVLYSGDLAGLARVERSITARYVFEAAVRIDRRPAPLERWLTLQEVRRNNVRGVDVRFPVAAMTAVTGVSGSGKSSLASQALIDLVLRRLGKEPETVEQADDPLLDTPIDITGGHVAGDLHGIRRVIQVDQKPIGRTPRSNLATYTGLFDHVRKRFAATKQAKAKRFDAGRFSFNVAKGRCETCEGEGFVSVELLFMPSVYAPCPTCHGKRYNDGTLAVRLRDRNIADVLEMTVDAAADFFQDDDEIARALRLLQAIGLGYLRLGQPATELSGGEAQRIKLATELQRPGRGDTLYLLDEPTTGLHPSDADLLLRQLAQFVVGGNTVVLVEHDMRIVAQCDWVIDMGPGAGLAGGRVVACGPPAVVAAAGTLTARYLAQWVEAFTDRSD